MRTQYLCLPLLKNTTTTTATVDVHVSPSTATTLTATTSSNRFLPAMSLLEQFRKAVFRLIMLTALSKATNRDQHPHPPTAGSPDGRIRRSYNYSPHDPHHSEAVADCIEFLKKSSSSVDDHHPRDSTATIASDIDSTVAGEVVFPRNKALVPGLAPDAVVHHGLSLGAVSSSRATLACSFGPSPSPIVNTSPFNPVLRSLYCVGSMTKLSSGLEKRGGVVQAL
ncbi:hypothetical protein Ancab_026583 [Ancistrocladus abbreviatus]